MTTKQFLHESSPRQLVREAGDMKSCVVCKRSMLSDGEVCGACKPPKVSLPIRQYLPGEQTGRNGSREVTLDAIPMDHAAATLKSVDMSVLRSGWAMGLMLGQIEYCHRLMYRKPKTRVLDVSNARTRRYCHCGRCEK